MTYEQQKISMTMRPIYIHSHSSSSNSNTGNAPNIFTNERENKIMMKSSVKHKHNDDIYHAKTNSKETKSTENSIAEIG